MKLFQQHQQAVWMVVLPVCAGIFVRLKKEVMPAQFDKIATGIASTAITLIILVVTFSPNRSHIASTFHSA